MMTSPTEAASLTAERSWRLIVVCHSSARPEKLGESFFVTPESVSAAQLSDPDYLLPCESCPNRHTLVSKADAIGGDNRRWLTLPAQYAVLIGPRDAIECLPSREIERIPLGVVRRIDASARFEGAAPTPPVGRNEPCPCGSGKKFKKCHGVAGGPQ
jgi:hypothetical protein